MITKDRMSIASIVGYISNLELLNSKGGVMAIRKFKRKISHDEYSQDLTIPTPVYLDYQTVFDMLAVIEDGLSQFQEIKTVYSDSKNDSNVGGVKINAQGRIPLGFLSMDGEGEGDFNKSREKTQSNSKEISSKKVHTSVSLFAKLRAILTERDKVKYTLDGESSVGDFVEFKSKFQKIEIVRLINTIVRAIALGNKFTNGKSKTKLTKEIDEICKLIKPIGDTLLSCESIENARCLIELDEDVAKQFNIERLLRGEYSVFGKIVRIERCGFNIFESTDLGLIKPDYLDTVLFGSFNGMVKKDSDINKMFNVPDKIPIIIEGAVFIVKPIAIFI